MKGLTLQPQGLLEIQKTARNHSEFVTTRKQALRNSGADKAS
jgi:hypothetical protein